MNKLIIGLILVMLLAAVSCAPSPTPVPTPPPAPAPAPAPDLDGVQEALGYSLAPDYMPEGFEFHLYQVMEVGGPVADVVYRKSNHHIFVRYPQRHPWGAVSSLLQERLGLDWQRPEDATSIVKVNGKPATVIRGMWSADTLQQLAKPDPELLRDFIPEWDYDFAMSLYLEYELFDDNSIVVKLETIFDPAEWITTEEMVKIAESLRQLD